MKLSFDVPTFAGEDKEFNHAISNYSGQSCEEVVPSGKAMFVPVLALSLLNGRFCKLVSMVGCVSVTSGCLQSSGTVGFVFHSVA